MRVTIGFRIYVCVLSKVQKEERMREREREPIFGVALYYDIFHRVSGYPGSLAARDAVVNDINVINTVILLPSLLLLLQLSLL